MWCNFWFLVKFIIFVQDMRFNPAVDIVNGENNKMYRGAWSCDCHMTGYEPTMMICMPMKVPMKVQQEDGSEQEFIAVAVACDKINGKMWAHAHVK